MGKTYHDRIQIRRTISCFMPNEVHILYLLGYGLFMNPPVEDKQVESTSGFNFYLFLILYV